jgi:CheY-like chemotaxis protein
MATVVVCDADVTVRSAVSEACAEAGLEVVAETDTGADAAELVRRFSVDVLVLDLFLSDGAGERTLASLKRDGSMAKVVFFTAYAPDPAHLRRLGAREVVDNHDYGRLGHVLDHLRDVIDRAAHVTDRRSVRDERVIHPATWLSPAGVAPHRDLARSLTTMEIGDTVLAVTMLGLEPLEVEVGPLLVADCRLALAGALRDELRVQDLVHEAPEVDGFVALLRSGDERAAGAVWSRLTAEIRAQGLPGTVKGACSRVDGMGAADAVARAVGALTDATADSASFLSV